MMAPRQPKTAGQQLKFLVNETWKVVLALVGLVALIQTGLNYLGPPRQTPAQAIQSLTSLLNSRDSAQAVTNETLKRGLLQNSYSICVIAKRPQSDCADILLNGGLR